jgi:type II secretory pathway pseudopilin PulG
MSSIINKKGFSIIEATIALLIAGMVMAAFGNVFKLLFDVNHKSAEQQNMQTIETAVNTFLRANYFLPCPDTDGDGKENRGGSNECSDVEGELPYLDLGVPSKDAWGNAYYYRVHDDADSSDVNEVCQPESVLGKLGSGGVTDLWLCPATNHYYCGIKARCDVACLTPSVSSTSTIPTVATPCVGSVDPRPNILNTAAPAPYYHLATPPIGILKGSGNLTVVSETDNTLELGEGIVAVIVSWGADGKQVNRSLVSGTWNDNCSGTSSNELENCDDDSTFVDTLSGENRDFIRWVTVNQAKYALIGSGEFR